MWDFLRQIPNMQYTNNDRHLDVGMGMSVNKVITLR